MEGILVVFWEHKTFKRIFLNMLFLVRIHRNCQAGFGCCKH